MNRFLPRSRTAKSSGFTLVELLVVMGIIAILASVLAVSAGAAIRAAKRAKAATIASQIQTAALNYYAEYNVYPITPAQAAGGDFIIDDKDSNGGWKPLLLALCGNINPYTGVADTTSAVTNSRGISYLSLKKSDVSATAQPLNPLPPDANSLYFNIAFDANYNGVMGAAPDPQILPDFTNSTLGNIKATGGTSTAGVAVWANCNSSTTPAKQNPSFYVKTY